MKKMLETSFSRIEVTLANQPPTFPKRLLRKVVPVVQIGVVGIVMAGEQIFPRLGNMMPPPWYLIASHTADYQHPMLFLNTFAVFVLVVAKFPNMHKVRIFGINTEQ
ncbi:hypothetical protein HHK36_023285 [Tetracentron sinense]|uniref:Uncharacterized protein n=1 Tax=Tetracentron sinense TaxID=13715 RepID=A0A834YNG2_TETSI|nr:hypothetical protein HHK36_023285 [Tetracentron sinense]